MPGRRQLLDERYGPSSDPKPLERKKLNRLGRLWKLGLTDGQMNQLEACLNESFVRADIAKALDGRLPSDPKNKRAAKRADDLDRVHRAEVRQLIDDVRNSAQSLIEALTRDPNGTTSGSDLSVDLWYGLSGVDDWESSDVASRALASARELFALAEKRLEGLPQSDPPRPKQGEEYLDSLLRSFALMWARFTAETPPTSPRHIFFRMTRSYLRLAGYQAPTAKALSSRWVKIVGPSAVHKKTSAQKDLHKQLLAESMSFPK